MNFGKTMASAAVVGMLAGVAVACGGDKPAEDPSSAAGKAACNSKDHCGASAHGTAEPATTAAPATSSTAK
jgi:hypothetical protein